VTPVRLPAGSVERRGRGPAALAAVLISLLAACGGGDPDPARPEAQASDRAERPDADAAPPTTVELPSIGVRARVIRLGLTEDGALETPKDYAETGWWSGGHAPGERGPAVIAGHVDSKDGPAVFYELDELGEGDRVRVRRADGSVVAFAVQRIERHSKDDFPTDAVYGPTSHSTLRLITCSGDFDESTGHYVDNTIVFASRV
jgi:LPXTG-site transpeptidase (sortase) family protein